VNSNKLKLNLKKVPLGDEIPNGWRIMTLEEAKKYKQEVNEVCDYKNNKWFIVAFETGRLDGLGHGNKFSENYGSEVGEKIIIKTEINDASQPEGIISI